MNENIKPALLFVGGVAVGALIATLALRQVYEARLQAELDSIREAFREKQEFESTPEEAQTDDILDESDESQTAVVQDAPQDTADLDSYEQRVKTNYGAYAKETPTASPDSESHLVEVVGANGVAFKILEVDLEDMPMEEFEQLTRGPSPDREEPFLISRREMEETEFSFIKSTLTYYEGDGIMADDDNEVLEYVENHIGLTLLRALPYMRDLEEPNTVFVRNERLRADYEILVAHEAYSELILGFTNDRKE